jgi:hypothetical protein
MAHGIEQDHAARGVAEEGQDLTKRQSAMGETRSVGVGKGLKLA